MIPATIDPALLLPTVMELAETRPQRIPYPVVDPGEQGVYGPITNGQLFARHLQKAVSDGVSTLAGALLREGALPPGLREMIIVRVGYLTGSLYEVAQHRSLGERLGISVETLDSLAARTPTALAAGEAAMIGFVDALINTHRVDDETLSAVRAQFEDTQVIEAVVVVGNWWMLSRLLATGDVPLDEGRIGERGVA